MRLFQNSVKFATTPNVFPSCFFYTIIKTNPCQSGIVKEEKK